MAGGQKVTLKVEFDDQAAKAGMDNLLKRMQEGGATVTQAGQGGGRGGAPDKGGTGDAAAASELRSFGKVFLTELLSQSSQVLVQAFDPQKTARQKTEAGVQAGAEIGGAAIGAAIGSALPGIGTIVGAAVGREVGKLAGQIAEVIDRKNKAVDESISQTLQQEASMRARLGVPIDRDEMRRIGIAARRGAEAEYDAQQVAISVTNEVSPGFLGMNDLGMVRGRRADQGRGAAYRDMLAQQTGDRD